MYIRSVLSDYIGYLIGQDSTLNGSTQIVDPAKKSSNNGNTQIRKFTSQPRKCFRCVTATLVVQSFSSRHHYASERVRSDNSYLRVISGNHSGQSFCLSRSIMHMWNCEK